MFDCPVIFSVPLIPTWATGRDGPHGSSLQPHCSINGLADVNGARGQPNMEKGAHLHPPSGGSQPHLMDTGHLSEYKLLRPAFSAPLGFIFKIRRPVLNCW